MRRVRVRNRAFKIFFVLVLSTSVLFGYVLRRIEKPFETAFSSFASEVANEAVRYAADKSFSDVSYKNLVSLTCNSDNEIVSLSANTVEMNNIKAEFGKNIKEYLSSINSKSVKLFLGASQSKFLFAGFGPQIKVRINPYSVTKLSFRDEFESVGINQVRHCIYIDVCIRMTVVSVSRQRSFDMKNSILVSDTVIVGRVPQVYGGFLSGINNKLE